MRYVLCALLVACADPAPPQGCVTTRDCVAGTTCTNGICVLDGPDSGEEDALDVGVEDASMPDAAQDISLVDVAPDVAPDAGTDAGPCGGARCGWRLQDTTWTSFALMGPFAPTLPVRAAFDIDSHDLAYLLTDTTYHVFRPSDQSFTAAGMRDDLMPEANGVPVVSATGAPSGNPLFQVIVTAADLAHLYDFDPSSRTFVHTGLVTEFSDDWMSSRAPARAAIQAAWRSGHDDRAWVEDSATCVVVAGYAAFISNGSVFPRDFGDCRVFLDIVPFDEFSPFAFATAPPSPRLGAAFFHEDELWVFDE